MIRPNSLNEKIIKKQSKTSDEFELIELLSFLTIKINQGQAHI